MRAFGPVDLALFVWELPQNLLGAFILWRLNRRGAVVEIVPERHRLFVHTTTAVSLGRFIFWYRDDDNPVFDITAVNRDHEYGHSVQSRLLGPLYLPVIGLPSYLRTVYARWYYRRYGAKWKGYYRGFPERWADRIAGVDSHAGTRSRPLE